MTHDELLKKINSMELRYANEKPRREALRAVVKLHNPEDESPKCRVCQQGYPCPTIEAIEKALT